MVLSDSKSLEGRSGGILVILHPVTMSKDELALAVPVLRGNLVDITRRDCWVRLSVSHVDPSQLFFMFFPSFDNT